MYLLNISLDLKGKSKFQSCILKASAFKSLDLLHSCNGNEAFKYSISKTKMLPRRLL